MFKKIVVAYDESPEAKRALIAAIDLATQLRAELRLVTVREPLPVYVSYVEAAFPGSERILGEERYTFYENLQKEAKAQASAHGIAAEGVIIDGDETKV
jgi:nucleotide-binding universal stress UspA family protein